MTVHKTDVEEFTTDDWDKWNTWMVNKILSMNPSFIEFVNYVQILPPQSKKEIYQVYKEFLPKRKTWSKYIKSNKEKLDKELIKTIKKYFECSSKESTQYLKLLGGSEIEVILTKLGIEEKQKKKWIKQL